MKPLIVYASLFGPPSDSLAARALTMMAKIQGRKDVLVEIEPEYKDIYYRSLRVQGGMDFVDGIITPAELVIGIRLDVTRRIWPTVLTDRIVFQNVLTLLGSVSSLEFH